MKYDIMCIDVYFFGKGDTDMPKQRPTPLHWTRLDNAAKIYPAARRKNWSNVFRQSATLTEDVDVAVLRSALDVTVKRFPTIAAGLHKGAFWFYLEQVPEAPEIREEYSYPLIYMSKREMRKCAFRVIAYGNRIAVEFFHSLTDGTGALVFLKNLVAEYLEQKHGISIPYECGIVDRRVAPPPEELEDSFLKYAGDVPLSRRATDAWKIHGEPHSNGFLSLTCLSLPVDKVLELAHKMEVSVTVLLSAVMMRALLDLQAEKVPSIRRRKPIKLLIPINLRALFPSKTLRNFAMFVTPELDPRLGEYSFEEICKIIKYTLALENTEKHMRSIITTNVNDEKNLLLRLVPLPIKNFFMKAIFDAVGERKSCLTFSNLGLVRLPEEMARYVQRIDFIIGVQAASPYNSAMISYGDTIYVNFIRGIREPLLESHFYKVLQELGIPATVESNNN